MKQQLKTKKRGIYILPNLFTISALFAGFYAIIAAMRGHFSQAAFAIFIAMVLDSLDGRIARMTNSVSAFGGELDSLSDMVSFGIAPPLVMYTWILNGFGKIGWVAAFVYTVSVALRLARFNTQIGIADKRYFQGLPCPAPAGVMAGFVWTFTNLNLHDFTLGIIALVLTVFMGILMVSNIRFRSFKDFNIKDKSSFLTILIIVLALVLIAVNPPIVLFAAFLLYALSGPIITLWEVRKKRKLKKKLEQQKFHKK